MTASEHARRIKGAILYSIPFLLLIFFPKIFSPILFVLLSCGIPLEFYMAIRKKYIQGNTIRPVRLVIIATGGVALLSGLYFLKSKSPCSVIQPFVFSLLGGVLSISLLKLFSPFKKNVLFFELTFISFVVALWCGAGVFALTGISYNYRPVEYLIPLLSVIWTSDISQYYGGKIWGRTRIVPRISPGKTLEGYITGLLFSTIFGTIVFHILSKFDLWNSFLIAILIYGGGVGGDLFQSAVKRRYGLKDMGSLIPGHGGITDRIDSLLISSPILCMIIHK